MDVFRGLRCYQIDIHKVLVNVNERTWKRRLFLIFFSYGLNLVCFEKCGAQAKIELVMTFNFGYKIVFCWFEKAFLEKFR
jgi:hypothetical protein